MTRTSPRPHFAPEDYWAAHPDERAEAEWMATVANRRVRLWMVPWRLRPLADSLLDRLGRPGPRARDTAQYSEKRLTLTVEEAARTLGISRTLAYEAVRRGEIPHVRIGRRVLIPISQLHALLGGEGNVGGGADVGTD